MAFVFVSSSGELKSALANAQSGDTIKLAAGNYGDLYLAASATSDVNFPAGVTITSADAGNPAVFSGMNLRGVANLTIDGVVFDYEFAAGDPIFLHPFSVSDSRNITIRNSTFDGDVAQGVSASDNGYASGVGLSVRGSTNVRLENNEVSQFHRGIIVLESADIAVVGNDIHGIRSDGMNFAEVDGVLIERNHLHDFVASAGSTDHRDMIQFWTNGTDQPSRDIIIRSNFLDIGQGDYTQSIFMRNDQVDQGLAGIELFYQNVLIENNVIINGHLHGIVVGETNGLMIRNNSVLHADGSAVDGPDSGVEIPQISVAATSTGVIITNNLTSNIAGYTNQAGWTVTGNAIVQDQNANGSGYYGDIFLASSLEPVNGVHGFILLPGSALDLANVGSSLTQPNADSGLLAARFHVTRPDGNGAARVFDASFTDGLPAGTRLEWNFDDGTASFGTIVRHTFASGGEYGVTLTIRLPDGSVSVARLTVGIAGADVLELGPTGAFVAYDNGSPTVLAKSAAGSADGLQLGATGSVAIVSRAHVVDLVAADEFRIDMSLRADAAGSAGELFRLHGSLVASVTSTGELTFTLVPKAGAQVVLTTSGAGLGDQAEHDISITVADGQIAILVDGKILATRASTGDMAFSGSQDLAFGHPWGGQNFNGDLTAFRITADASDYPATPKSTVLLSSTLTGGMENNVFTFNETHLVIQDAGGTDEVQSSALSLDLRSWQLDGIENARLKNAATLNLTGDAGSNLLTGNSADNRLQGLGGADTLAGGDGNDTYVITDQTDRVVETGTGVDIVLASVNHTLTSGVENATISGTAISLTGNALGNVLTGNAANNMLDGRGGADTLRGGNGNDTYYVNHLGDRVVETGTGIDRVFAAISYTLNANIDNATLTGTARNLTGNRLDNTLIGNASDNRLDGMDGADRMFGGAGNDTYVINHRYDRVVESGGGVDRVFTSFTYIMNAGIENATLTGTARGLTGNRLDNILVGNASDNRLDGLGGADRMSGGAGNDTYIVNHGGDRVVESGGGIDRVFANLTYTLDAGIEKATLTGIARGLTGNRLDNRLMGNAADNRLDGMGGADRMTGAAGEDVFVFRNGHGRDIITDFDARGAAHDLLNLRDLSAITSFRDLIDNHARQYGDDVVISTGNGNAIRLQNVAISDLHAMDVLI
jgi:Ca2+-binding RTX toxin-like protein